MQNHLFTKQRGRPLMRGFRGMLAAVLFGTFLYATGAKAAPLNGTYTIDASGSGNYTTFKLAVTDLTNNGVSGPVVFNVTATTYTEVVSIGSITGASSTNTITFTGKGISKTILTSAGTTVTMKAYTIFDNMKITSTSTSANLINASASTACSITNCYVRTPSITNYAIYGNNSLGLTVYNCTVWGSYYAVYLYGAQSSSTYGKARISHNNFYNQYYYGVYDYYDFMDSIAFNTIDSGGVATMEDALGLYYLNGPVVWGNKVYVSSYEALYMVDIDYYPVTGSPTQSYLVNNWIVSPSGAANNYEPIYLYAYQSNNFVCAFNTYLGFGTADYPLIEFSSCTNVTFANNVFDNTSGGIYNAEVEIISSSVKLYDGNDFCGSGGSSGYIYFYNGTTGTTYASYSAYATAAHSAGYDLHGTNVVPPFVSTTYPYDLHMSTTKAAANKGVSGTGINTDIDGKGRFPTPTAGASESYYGVVNNNSGVTAMLSPIAVCPGMATVSVTVSDLGLNAINGSSTNTIAWSWNGTPQTSVNYSTSIPLYGQTSITLGTVTLTAGVSYTLKAWPTYTNGVANAGGSNDTLVVNGIMAALGGGIYTIDGTKATGGKNFKTFADAVTALNAGVCGPVVFNVTAATYNESVKIGTTVGASAVNTITFHGAGRTKTTLTNSGVPLTMSGSSYIQFDNMTISTTGTTTGVVNEGGTTKCRFISDNIIAPAYTSNSGNVFVSGGSTTGLMIKGCRLLGGYETMVLSSSFDSIINNRFIYGGYSTWYNSGTHGNVYQYNVIDSLGYASPTYGAYLYNESGATYDGNYFNFRNVAGALVNCSYDIYLYEPNYSATTVGTSTVGLPFSFVNNIVQGSATNYGVYSYNYYAKAPFIFAFNTLNFSPATTGQTFSYAYMGYHYYNNGTSGYPFSPEVFVNNIIQATGQTSYNIYDYEYYGSFQSGVSNWDHGDTMHDGNDYIIPVPATSGAFYTYNYPASSTTTAYPSVSTYLSGFCAPYNYERHGYNNIVPNYINALGNLYLDTTRAAPVGVPFCTPATNSTLVNYPGVDHDITGRKRCALFPTVGAFEDPFGKSAKATKIYVPSAGVYPGSPATIYQSHVTGDPAVYVWYIKNSNYSAFTPVGTSVNLYYNGWTTGANTLKLVTTSCSGMDSDMVSFTVSAPTAVPATDFIAASNAIQQNTSDLLTDLSTNGPTKWQWAITPDSITIGTTKVPTTNQYTGSPQLDFTQNPNITFYYPGFYKVCLTAYNGLGKGATDCKANYIQVVPATNLGTTPQTVTASTGYIYDNGGPQGNYTAIGSPYIESVLIAPCADSVYLTFSQFDTKCGADFVKLYNGSSPTAATQIGGTCGGGGTWGNGGTSGGGPGFNGGPTNVGCVAYCIPNVNRPDTFKSGPKMLLTMFCYTGGAPGFAAYYWVKPSSDNRVMPSFTTANGSDSVCAGQLVTYKNTTSINPKDIPSFEWDLNGDISDGFECVGTCATAQWPYFLPGTVPVTLIAINCGGADTLVKNITVVSPPKPVAAFSANIISPTLTDVVTFTSGTVQCVDAYTWSITPSAGNPGSAANFVNGTTAASPSPMVTFPDTGYYDVALTVSNAAGSQTNTKTILKYIHVREPYCQPSVAQLSSGIGINHVVFNTINNYTTPQASQGYFNFASNASLSTNIAVGATYYLSVSRDPNSIFSPINRDAWIDWNEDGSFTGTGENVLKDSNSTSETYTAKVTVPTAAKIGATVLRIAVNLYLYPNAPCGANQFGEYQDYRVYVTPYNILPVITLKGKDTITVEQGYPYSEPGDSASSYLYGDITSSIKVTSKLVGGTTSFSILVPGTYLFNYDVTDPAGNKAVTKHRVVIVTPDKTPPNLILAKNSVSGTDTIYQEVSTLTSPPNLNPSLRSYVVSSIDLVEGNLTGNVSIDSSLVQLNVVGVYPVIYTSADLGNPPNTAIKTLYVDVIDTIKPVLTLNGPNPDTIEVNVPFVDPGVSVSVSNSYLSKAQLLRYLHVTSTVNDSALGTYKVTYSLRDTFGNVAKPVTRIVVTADKLAPALTLLGPVHDSVLVNNTYYERGYTVSDNFTKTANIKITTSGTFVTTFKNPLYYASKLGGGRDSNKVVNPRFTQPVGPAYRLTYTATDQAGNKSSVTRYIEVYDNVAPVIELIGDRVVNECRWFPYTDAGYTFSDNYTDTAHLYVMTHGSFPTVGTSLAQSVDLWYTAEDQAGNVGSSADRVINVKEAGSFGCVSGIASNLGLDKAITIFPNPSAGIFNVEANLPLSQNVRISVMNMLGQELAVVHDGSLMNNSFRVDLSNQASGVYFLNIVSNNQTLTKRIEIAK